MTKKMTHENYIQRVNSLVGEEYTILEKYVDTKTKLLTRHNVCKREWKICPNKFLGGRRCPKCNFELQAERQKKSFQEVCKEVLERTNGEFEIIGGEYKRNKSKILFLHKKCKNQFWMSVSNLLTRKLCPICNKIEVAKKIRKTHEQFVEDIYKLYGSEYSVVGKYIRSIEKISIKHNICNTEWMVSPANILRKFGCPKCANESRKRTLSKSQVIFSKEVEELGFGDYLLIGDYISQKYKVSIKHLLCDNIWEIFPSNFIKGRRCPYCYSMSNGESMVEGFLRYYQLQYSKNFSFVDCRDKYLLTFDFGVKDNEKIILIEYQGVQHYESVKIFGGDKKFSIQKLHDEIKRMYCANNNLKLITIPYWEIRNIKDILENELSILLERR